MHRFYLAPNDWAAATLTEAEAHHARNVEQRDFAADDVELLCHDVLNLLSHGDR